MYLGNLDISRDWGWAPEYVEAMWMMLQQEDPQDYVIATGISHTLEEFLDIAFSSKKLNFKHHVIQKEELIRPNELSISKADPSKINNELKWKSRKSLVDIINYMLADLSPQD